MNRRESRTIAGGCVDDLLLWDRNVYRSRLGNGALPKEMTTRGVLNSRSRSAMQPCLEISTYRGLPMVEHKDPDSTNG